MAKRVRFTKDTSFWTGKKREPLYAGTTGWRSTIGSSGFSVAVYSDTSELWGSMSSDVEFAKISTFDIELYDADGIWTTIGADYPPDIRLQTMAETLAEVSKQYGVARIVRHTAAGVYEEVVVAISGHLYQSKW